MIATILISFTITTLLHYNFKSYDSKKESINTFTNISKLPGIIRSVSFVEHRFIEYEDYSTTINPTITNVDYLGFAYDK